jgi:hypothetical protein
MFTCIPRSKFASEPEDMIPWKTKAASRFSGTVFLAVEQRSTCRGFAFCGC